MEEYSFLLSALEKTLGKSKKTARDNYAFRCPFCNHPGHKLEINLQANEKGENKWACWVCKTRGKTVFSLVKQLELDKEKISEILKHTKKGEYREYTGNNVDKPIELPKEYIPLVGNNDNSILAKIAKNYLKKRNISDIDILRYDIGYCSGGRYDERIIIPSYDINHKLNYFIARSFTGKQPKYLNPEASRDVVIFENLINWNQPLIVCEGGFDAIAIKRNVTPILGKSITKALYKRIYQSSLEDIYIALDRDAMVTSVEYCEQFLKMGKKVYLVEMEEKDPSVLGFENFTNLIQEAHELSFSGLVQYKLNLI